MVKGKVYRGTLDDCVDAIASSLMEADRKREQGSSSTQLDSAYHFDELAEAARFYLMSGFSQEDAQERLFERYAGEKARVRQVLASLYSRKNSGK